MDDFNAAPIMLQHPSSLGGNDKIYDQPSSFCDMDDDVAVDTLVVPQNLAPEQFQYEFPPKSRLKALAHLYDDDDCSFFDEQSFTTASTTSTAAYSTITDEEWSAINHSQYDVNDHLDRFLDSVSEAFSPAAALVDDGKLSPLQLPVQAASDNSNEYRAREQSCDSTSTVTAVVRNKNQGVCPSTFLDDARHAQAEKKDDLVDRRFHDMPIIRSESELSDDNDSDCTSDSKVVFVRLSKRVAVDGTRRCVSSRLWTGSDEGYDEALDDDKELPIESSSVFLPVSEEIDQHDLCTAAAIKIQAAWRGYRTRKHLTAHKAAASMVRVCGAVHRRQMTRLQERLDALERRLAEETAMRMAFEKAMEDMTILVDQQQNMLYDRIEQETKMRQIQERKANEALAHMERRLQKEVRAREELQATTMQILNELKELKAASRRQQRQQQQDEKTTAKTHHHRLFAQQQNLDATMKRGSPATITATTLRRTGATSAGRASPATRMDIINIKRSALRPASRTTRTPISTV